MIGDLFFNIVYWFASSIIAMFPASQGFPEEVHTAASTIGGYFGMFDSLIPIATLLTCITLIFSVEIGIFGFRTVKWVISHLPLIGGRG